MIKIFHNLHLKIIALVAAIFLWFFVVGVDNTVSIFPETLNIEINNISKNISVANSLPQAKIYLKGDKDIIKNLTKNDFSAYVDVSDKGVGEYQVPILVNSKNSQVVIIKVEPKNALIKLAPLAEKEVDVKISLKGQPKADYKTGDIQAEITKVKISGAQPVLDTIQNVTAELLLDGTETSDISRKVVLSVPEMKNFPENSFEINPNEIQITVRVMPEIGEKEVEVKPNFKSAQDEKLWLSKITLNPPQIKIHGDAEALKDIDTIMTEYISVNDLPNLTTPLTMKLSLPPNITLVNPEQKITLSVTKETIEQKSFTPAINFTSASGLKLKTASTYNLTVNVKGESSILKKLTKEDIEVNLNLDLASGTGNITVLPENIKLPNGFELVDFQPKQLQVELSP